MSQHSGQSSHPALRSGNTGPCASSPPHQYHQEQKQEYEEKQDYEQEVYQQPFEHPQHQQHPYPYQERPVDHPRSPTPGSAHSQIYELETASVTEHDHNDHHDQAHVYYDHPEVEEGELHDIHIHQHHHPKQQQQLQREYPEHEQEHYTREDVGSPSNTYADTPEPPHHAQAGTRGQLFRLRVMSMATVWRLRMLWALLALFGTMSWLSLMPAYAFRNKLGPIAYVNPVYTLFLVATVSTSVAAIWQSLNPFLIRRGGLRSLWPMIINHPGTQTTTIVLSAILTILNFFSWILLAANKDDVKTNCEEGSFAHHDGYTLQCRGVNVAVILDAFVFLLWTPILLVIVCGTVEKGLWWWGEHEGWAHSKERRMMTREEYDLKVGLGARPKTPGPHQGRPHNASIDNLSQVQYDEIQTPKLAFVTPIASQFRSEEDEIAFGTGQPHQQQSYGQQQQRQQQQQQQQQHQQQRPVQEPRRLRHKGSNQSLAPSLSARLSGFFGAGWSSGPMPPSPEPEPAMPPSSGPVGGQYRAGPSRLREQQHFQSSPSSEMTRTSEPDKASINGDAYMTQWHSRRQDDWS